MRNARGERQRIVQADQILFLRPAQNMPRGSAIEVAADALPDVVLEVDNTTDVRRNKLRLYESWGIPEVWVEVPDEPAPSRPASLRPGLTIHLREGGRFRSAPVGRAFPAWTAAEIHRALNEPELSEQTAEVLDRVGRAWARRRARDLMTIRSCAVSANTVRPAIPRAAPRRNAALRCSGPAAFRCRLTLRALAELGGRSERLVDAALQCRRGASFCAWCRPRA